MPRTKLPGTGANARTQEHNFYDLRSAYPTTGNIWFVDSGAASGGNGLSPEGAVTTLAAANTLATANNGDIIIGMEGHAETITAAAGATITKAGVRFIGLGVGRNRPTFTFTTDAAASFDITAANVHVQGVVLINGIASQTAMLNVTAAGVALRDCEVQVSDGTTAAVLGVLTSDAADRLIIDGCHFHGVNAVTAAIRIVGADYVVVKNNLVTGLYATTGAVEQVTTAGVDHLYQGNTILNRTADGNNKAIVLKSDTTALIVGNVFAVIDSTSPAPYTAAAGYFGANYHVGAANTAGTLI